MKILHIHWRYDRYGGGERYLHAICNAQEELGHKVIIIIFFNPQGSLFADRKVYLVEPSVGLRSGRRSIKKINMIIEDEAPDIVHFHQTYRFLSPLIVRHIHLRMPAVKTVHDVGLLCPNAGNELIKVRKGKLCNSKMGIRCAVKDCYPIFTNGATNLLISLWEKEMAKRLDRIIVSSNYMREELLRNSFNSKKIRVLPLYTEINRNGRLSLTESEDRNKEKILLFIGRLDSVKGVIQFIQALNIIREKEWKADIVGEGTFFSDAQDMVSRMKLNDRVMFHGKVSSDKVGEFYSKAYLVSMPSMIPESFGLVGIEAMAFGKPVVAFDSGGIREWLVDGETGFLVKRGNIKGLADKISQLLEDGSLARKMGEKGKEWVETYYRKEKHIERLIAVYEEAISSRVNMQGNRRGKV